MEITITTEGGRRYKGLLPFNGADHVIADSDDACPACGCGKQLKVRGYDRTHDHDTYRADAIALCCGKRIGRIEARVSTIFGIEEDEAVLFGRCRVY